MYLINKLNRNVLIMTDEVLFHAPTDQEIDDRQILSNIIVAEERWIANVLGNTLYEFFIDAKNKVINSNNQASILALINADHAIRGLDAIILSDLKIGMIINAIEFVTDPWLVKLWNRFLWKLTAECVDVTATIPSWVRHTSAGQMKNNPNVLGGNGTNSASADLKEVELKVRRAIQDRIDPLMERMKMWICINQDNFTFYNVNCKGFSTNNLDNELDGISHVRKTNIITDLYKDKDQEKEINIRISPGFSY